MTDSVAYPAFSSVHAAAGSGKTYLLVSRLIRILILGAEPGSILAITFTRKAAAEMQQRLLQRVYELAVVTDAELDQSLTSLDLPLSDETRNQARCLYETLLYTQHPVRTTTFHAFCQDLLRRFPMEADIPPGFELTERIGYLLDEAWAVLGNELTRDSESETAKQMDYLLAALGMTTTRQLMDQFIQHRSEWWALQDSGPDALQEHLQQLDRALGISRASASDPDDLLHEHVFNAGMTEQLREFLDLLGKHPNDTNLKHAHWLTASLDDTRPAATRFDFVWKTFFNDNHKPRSRKSSQTLKSKLGEAGCERFILLHNHICETLADYRQRHHAWQTSRLSRAWMLAGRAYLDHFQAIKQQRRLLDFTDLEWQCYRLLNKSDHSEWVQYKLDQRINHLLIDEFQDTNPTQWNLILPLLKELAAGVDTQRQRSVLFVGDAKQSIYRFRRAEPRLFSTASEWIEQKLSARRQKLTRSYRSSPAIIQFVNQLFTTNAGYPLDDFDTHDTERRELPGSVTLLPLVAKKDQAEPVYMRNPLIEPRQISESGYYDEARLVTHHIQQLLASGMTTVVDNQTRLIDYGDIMLLFRNRTHVRDYERALREAHIPYIGTERGTLLDSLEVRDMVGLLQWLITPFDNLALAGILRSPLFSIDDADLLMFSGKHNWFEQLLDSAPDYPDQHPLSRAARLLPDWIRLADQLPVHDLLDHIYSAANVLARYRANYPPHLQARVTANLQRFIELALEGDSGRYPSLTRFLAWLDILKQQDQEAPDQPAGAHELNRIRLLTIHEAKGLEAPVVFLLDASSSAPPRRGAQVLVDWPADTDRPDTFFVSPSAKIRHRYCETVLNMLDGKQHREEANLLYVAVTRARQYLYISATHKANAWYANICRQYDIDPNTLEQPRLLSTHGTATLPDQPVPPPITKTGVKFEPRLHQPFHLTPLLKEIAPSRMTGEHHFTSHSIDEDQRERGRSIHHMLEQLARDPHLTLADYRRAHQPNIDPDTLASYWQEASNTQRRYPELFDTGGNKAYAELPVVYRKDGVTINGIIDRLIIYPDKISIIDYKTHQIESGVDPVQFSRQFREQMLLYRQGLELAYPGKAVSTAILLTAIPCLVDITTT